MTDIEKRINAIERRNQKVEMDKAWETSWARRLSIAGLTYLVVVVYLLFIGNDKPYINAAVPAGGFVLSTLVLPQIKTIWQKHRN